MSTKNCTICFNKRPTSSFVRCTSKCTCTPNYCKDCILKYIKSKLIKNLEQIKCFSCNTVFEISDLKKISQEMADRYTHLLDMAWMEKQPEFFWCAHKGCGSGQLVEGLNPKNMKGVFFTCCKCKRKTCCFHKVPLHEGLSCDEYQLQIESSETSKTMYWIRKMTKSCPKCNQPIEKNGGCDHV